MSMPTDSPLPATPLIGREALLDELRIAVIAGTGETVVLTGQAGAGRTRLLAALGDAVRAAGVATCLARGEGKDALPYAALRPWLLGLVKAGERAPFVVRLVPEVGGTPAPVLDGPAEQVRAHDAIACLAAETYPGRTVWLLDDVDRLDAASLALLAAWRRAGAGLDWSFVLTATSEAIPADARLRPLDPLYARQLQTLACAWLGCEPVALPAAVSAHLPRVAGGLPGRAEAALASWVATGALVQVAGHWQARPEGAFVPAAAMPIPVDPPATLAAARAALDRHGYATAARFALALLADDASDRRAVLQVLVEANRCEGRLDEALTRLEGQLLPLLRLTPGPELAVILITLGELLTRKGRPDDALAALGEAINLAETHGLPHEAVRARLLAGRAGIAACKHGVARTTLGAALRRARVLPAGESLVAHTLVALSGLSQDAQASLVLLDEAVTLQRVVGDPLGLSEALDARGQTQRKLGRPRDAHTDFAEGLALRERVGLDAVEARLNLAGTLLDLGRPREAAAHAHRAAVGAGAAEKGVQARALGIEGPALVRLGEPGRGLLQVEAGLALASETGDAVLMQQVALRRNEVLLDVGAWDAIAAPTGPCAWALAVLTDAPDAETQLTAAVTQAGPHRHDLAHALRWLAELHARRESFEAATVAAIEALAHAEALGLAHLEAELHGLLATGPLGRAERGAHHARRAADVARAAGDALGAIIWEALAARRAGDARTVRNLAERLTAMAADLPTPLQAGFWHFPERQAIRAKVAPGIDGGLPPARLRHLKAIIAKLGVLPDLGAVMDQALAGLMALANAERGLMVLTDGFDVREQRGVGAPCDMAVAQQVLTTGSPLFIEDTSVAGAPARSVLGLPLLTATATIGVMVVEAPASGEGLGEAELALLLALTEAIALAIGAARLHAAAVVEQEAAAAVQALACATAGLADADRYAQAVLAAALRVTGAERGFLLRRDGPEAVAVRGTAGPLPVTGSADVDPTVCAGVLLSQVPVFRPEPAVWTVPLGAYGLLYLDAAGAVSGDGGLPSLQAIAGLAAAFFDREPAA